jgi:hypothetical protein
MGGRNFESGETWRRGLKAAGTRRMAGKKCGGINQSKIQNVQHEL